MDLVIEAASQRYNITATTTLTTKGGKLMGVWVSSASNTPTIKVADSAGTIANTFTPTGPAYYPLPTKFNGSLVVTIGGTVDCTVFLA